MTALGPMKSWLRNKLARRLHVPEIPVALARIAGKGFAPSLIFDVGAYAGEFTKTCLAIWPGARIGCFEVQPRRVQQLQELATGHEGTVQVHPVLLGARHADEVILYEAESASSVLKEKSRPQRRSNFYPMSTVDGIVSQSYGGTAPDLLKLDVQGYELEVLKGARESLSRVQMILAEINLLDIHDRVPLLADTVSWLQRHSFVAYDICGLTRRPLDDALWQADFIFVQENSDLRRDKRWNAG